VHCTNGSWNIDGGFNWYAGVGGGLGTLYDGEESVMIDSKMKYFYSLQEI
jgi:hypothetical protein